MANGQQVYIEVANKRLNDLKDANQPAKAGFACVLRNPSDIAIVTELF